MTHLLIVVALAAALLVLVRTRLIQVDLLLPWFLAIVVLGFASTQPAFVNWLGAQLGILYPPIAILFLVIFLLVGILVVLSAALTRLRARQLAIVRHLAAMELAAQERGNRAWREIRGV